MGYHSKSLEETQEYVDALERLVRGQAHLEYDERWKATIIVDDVLAVENKETNES